MPHVYLKVIASLVPKELKLEKDYTAPTDYSEEELMAIILEASKMGTEVVK